ncbi:hypothetical protein JTB14_017282 [Gonioctena quinquepunctata]|nr:hypothetical protein JTB14_017282 [Gonioctena quinquepunctata]
MASTTEEKRWDECVSQRPRGVNDAFLTSEISDESHQNLESLRDVSRKIETQQQYQKEYYKRHAMIKKFTVGQHVVVQANKTSNDGKNRKLEPRYKGPFVVTKVLDNERQQCHLFLKSKIYNSDFENKVTPYDLAEIFKLAYEKVANIDKGVSGFKTCGIFPVDPTKFSDSDFAPAENFNETSISLPSLTNIAQSKVQSSQPSTSRQIEQTRGHSHHNHQQADKSNRPRGHSHHNHQLADKLNRLRGHSHHND